MEPITTPAAWMESALREAFERLCELDDLLGHRVGVDRLTELRARLEGVIERLPRAFRHELRDPIDDPVRDLEHPPRVAERSARCHRGERDDLCDPVAPVLLRHVVDHAVAARHCEVDVGVGQRLAAGVEEPLEEQVVADRDRRR